MASNNGVNGSKFEGVAKQVVTFLQVHLEEIRSSAKTEFRISIDTVLNANNIQSIDDPAVAEILATVQRARDDFCTQNTISEAPRIRLIHSLSKKI